MTYVGPWQPAQHEVNAEGYAGAYPAQISAGAAGFDPAFQAPGVGNTLYTIGGTNTARYTVWPSNVSGIGVDRDYELGGPEYGRQLFSSRADDVRTPSPNVDMPQAFRSPLPVNPHPAARSMPEDAIGVEYADDNLGIAVVESGRLEVMFDQYVQDASLVEQSPPALYAFEVRTRNESLIGPLLGSTVGATPSTAYHYGFFNQPGGSWDVTIEGTVSPLGEIETYGDSTIPWADPSIPLNVWLAVTTTGVASDGTYDGWMWRPSITEARFKVDCLWPAYRYIYANSRGHWNHRQAQAVTGNSGGWPARYGPNGGHTGGWPARFGRPGI